MVICLYCQIQQFIIFDIAQQCYIYRCIQLSLGVDRNRLSKSVK